MKVLRILTGRHAGARVDLLPGLHRVGASADNDIAVTDWTFAPLALRVDEQSVTAVWPDADGMPEHTRRLDDFQPGEFDGSVLCVGPDDAEWPSDVTLLAGVFQSARQDVKPGIFARLKRLPRIAIWSGGIGLCVTAGLSAALLSAAASPSQPPALTLQATQTALQKTLDGLAPGRLQVTTEGTALVIGGLLDAGEQAAAVRAAAERVRGRFSVAPRFSVASDVAEQIKSAVGLPGATVKYAGGGVFSYVAEADDEQAARAAIDRVSEDLAPAVRRIDVTLEHVEKPVDVPILSSLTGDGVVVMQTRDGVKHLVVKPEEPPIVDGRLMQLPLPDRSMFPPGPASTAAANSPKE